MLIRAVADISAAWADDLAVVFIHMGAAAITRASPRLVGGGKGSEDLDHPCPYFTIADVSTHWDDPEFLRHVFEQTQILRKPITGIITGYHVLPYILVGPQDDQPHRSVEVRGGSRCRPASSSARAIWD